MAASVIFVSYVICLSFVVLYGLGTPRVSQEGAKVLYHDPKYVKNPQAFTSRARRGDAYRSNFTVEILQPWGNNVTAIISYKGKNSGNDVFVKGRCCDLFDIQWMGDYIAKFMGIKKMCPVPVGTYGLYNIELPPKGFIVPFPTGEGTLFFTYLLEGKKRILQYAVKINIGR